MRFDLALLPHVAPLWGVQVRLSSQAANVVKKATSTTLVGMFKRSNAFVVDELLKESPTYQKLLSAVEAHAKKPSRA